MLNNKINKTFIISLAVSILLSFMLINKYYSNNHLAEIITYFSKVGFIYYFLCALLISIMINILLGPYKWKLIFQFSGISEIKYSKLLTLWLITAAFDLVVPFRVNKFAPALYLKKNNSIPILKTVSTIINDKYLNVIGTAIIALTGAVMNLFATNNRFPSLPIIILCMIALLIFFCFPHVISNLSRKSIYIENLLLSFDMAIYHNVFLLILSIIYQLSEIACVALIFSSLEVPFSVPSLVLVYPGIMLASYIPFSVAGIGVRELLIIQLFANYRHEHILLIAGILVSMIEYLFPAFAGIITFLIKRKEIFSHRAPGK